MKNFTKLHSIIIAFLLSIGMNLSAQTPSTPSADSGHYYILYSTQDGTTPLLRGDGSQFKPAGFLNTSGKVLYAPSDVDNTKLKYGDISDAPSRDHALWQIEKACGDIIYLKNKATGKYVRRSSRVSDTPHPMEISAEEGSTTQYSFRTQYADGTYHGYCIAWQNNQADSWQPQQGENGYTAWIWEEQTETFTVPTLACTSLTVVGSTGGTAYIKIDGRPTNTQVDGTGTEIYAVPDPGYQFVKWNDGTNDYSLNPYTYVGTDDKTFTATFEKLSENSTVLTPTNVSDLENKYFFIQSGANGLASSWNAGDTRSHLLYANGAGETRLKHNTLANVPDGEDYALWFIDNGKLKNKGSKLYLTGSRDQNSTGDNLEIEVLSDNQYQIKAGSGSYTCAWQNYTADRLSSQSVNSATAWYFIQKEEIPSGTLNPVEKNYSIVIKDGVLNVLGATNFTVYTLTGQKVSNKQALQTGVYLVKVNNTVQKVVVD